jgi:hypothetical protein
MLTTENAKTTKSVKLGFLTAILYLAPHKQNSKGANLCPFATAGCILACLFSAGRGAFDNVRSARIRRTEAFLRDRFAFLDECAADINKMLRKAVKLSQWLCVRLNGTSDIAWEKVKMRDGRTLLELFPLVQFYDYTKNPVRMTAFLNGEMPSNYHLTFSRSGDNDALCRAFLKSGGNVAAVIAVKRGQPLPKVLAGWEEFPVVGGDETDVRFQDGTGVIVALRAKGKAIGSADPFILAA